MSATVDTTLVDRVRIRQKLRDRWDTIMIDVDPFNAEETNSKDWNRLSSALRHLAGRMIHGAAGAAEYSALTKLEEELIGEIDRRVMAFAEQIEVAREEASQ